MIRFPNPGSDIPSFIRIFQTLYTYLSDKAWFGLDEMSATLTSMNLAASSGYVGGHALALSTREDQSRDPLYNQSKMYAELFRTLGWMVSDDPEAALRFRFSLLGDHAAAADVDPKAIFEESVLGINYPLIADLFTLIGFRCHFSRPGINYERWDAIAVDNAYTIPIEIKSPTEEEYISVKAVRQALENKIILLSRRSYPTDWNTVTLAVGYYPPNERAEVSRLIADIKETFGIRIGIIDLQPLLTIASESVRNGGDHVADIRQMEGLINVESI